jgi:methylated-DNA-[protein]-cysteine S-methyltransferase
MRYSTLPTPIGELVLTADPDGALTRLYLPNRPPDTSGWERDDALLEPVLRQLGEYFAGERTEFDLPLEPAGTPFQRSTWLALREIPYAETINYGQLALRVGNPKASRAVGLANGRNPISIVVPCHRVIGADGSLTGYGGGLDRKRLLLDLERRVAGAEDPQLSLL